MQGLENSSFVIKEKRPAFQGSYQNHQANF